MGAGWLSVFGARPGRKDRRWEGGKKIEVEPSTSSDESKVGRVEIEGEKLRSWTRRRPKRMGLCRGADAEGGKKQTVRRGEGFGDLRFRHLSAPGGFKPLRAGPPAMHSALGCCNH